MEKYYVQPHAFCEDVRSSERIWISKVKCYNLLPKKYQPLE